MKPVLGLVVALSTEARALLGRGTWRKFDGWPLRHGRLKDGSKILCVLSGVGMDQAHLASRWLTGQGVSVLASMGISGGLHPDIKPGALIIAESVLELLESGNGGKTNLVWASQNSCAEYLHKVLAGKGFELHLGKVISTRQAVLTSEGKKSLYQKSGALAVDMECAAVAHSAREAGIPFFALRAVCDPCEQTIPPDISNSLNENGQIKPWFIMRKLLRRPSLVKDLLRTGRDYKTALSALGRAWQLQVKYDPGRFLSRILDKEVYK